MICRRWRSSESSVACPIQLQTHLSTTTVYHSTVPQSSTSTIANLITTGAGSRGAMSAPCALTVSILAFSELMLIFTTATSLVVPQTATTTLTVMAAPTAVRTPTLETAFAMLTHLQLPVRTPKTG